MSTKVAIQGIEGSFHHQAVQHYFADSKDLEILGKKHFKDVFESLDWGEADYGCIAIENSIAGSIYDNYDLLTKYNYPIIGEIFFKIQHCLISLPDVKMADIKTVYSHPVALAQCTQYINDHRFQAIPKPDTAKSVVEIKEKSLKDAAAIASCVAADLYDMQVLEAGIQDHENNYTRFLILGKKHNEQSFDKISLNFVIKNEPGAILNVLKTIYDHGGDMTKIESRPILGEVWQYQFYVDVTLPQEKYEGLIDELAQYTTTIRVLGKYKQGEFVG